MASDQTPIAEDELKLPVSWIDVSQKVSSMILTDNESKFIIGTREASICKYSNDDGALTIKGSDLGSVWALVLDRNNNFYAGGGSGLIKKISSEDLSEITELRGHTDEVNCMKISPDHNFLYSCSDDFTVRKWSLLSDPIESKTLYSHTSLVYTLDVSFNGDFLASGGKEKTITVYSIEEEKEIKTLSDIENIVWCVKFTPDTKYLISGDESAQIIIWNVGSWEKLNTLLGHSQRIRCLDVSINGLYLLSGSLDGTVKVWNIEEQKLIKTLAGHKDWVKSALFSKNNQKVYSAGDDQKIAVWDINQLGLNPSLKIENKKSDTVLYVVGFVLVALGLLYNKDKIIRTFRSSIK